MLGTYSSSPMMLGGNDADNPNYFDVWDTKVDSADNILVCGQVHGNVHPLQTDPATSAEAYLYKLDSSGRFTFNFKEIINGT